MFPYGFVLGCRKAKGPVLAGAKGISPANEILAWKCIFGNSILLASIQAPFPYRSISRSHTGLPS
jgi:hypothetical protein